MPRSRGLIQVYFPDTGRVPEEICRRLLRASACSPVVRPRAKTNLYRLGMRDSLMPPRFAKRLELRSRGQSRRRGHHRFIRPSPELERPPARGRLAGIAQRAAQHPKGKPSRTSRCGTRACHSRATKRRSPGSSVPGPVPGMLAALLPPHVNGRLKPARQGGRCGTEGYRGSGQRQAGERVGGTPERIGKFPSGLADWPLCADDPRDRRFQPFGYGSGIGGGQGARASGLGANDRRQ